MTLYEQRTKLVADMRTILDKADKEQRDLTAEETGQYDRMEADVETLDKDIEKAEAAEARRVRLQDREERQRNQPPGLPQLQNRDDAERHGVEEMAAFRRYLMSGEHAALQMDSDTGGGTLVAPEQFMTSLIDGLDETVAIRGMSSVFRVPNAHSLGFPSLDADPADDTWTSEILTGSADSTMALGKRNLHPHPLAKRLLVSKKLLRASPMMVDSIVRDRLLFKMAVTQEKAFLTGTGANQPLGVFTASADGISTGQDVSTDNTTTAITADGLINAKYTLKEQYLRSANLSWVFHRDAIKMIRKLKDGNGDYLWSSMTQGIEGDRRPTILDVPYVVSEFAPNTFTTGLYVGIIGDFRFYYIADALDMTIEVANELYMATNQSGYFIRSETDAMPVLEEAFVRVKLA